jgi:hypothetical protein
VNGKDPAAGSHCVLIREIIVDTGPPIVAADHRRYTFLGLALEPLMY